MTIFVITGQTGTGKTALSIALAQKYSAEIISADSRQVFRGLDFCSNKITSEEMQGIPHYGIDIVEAGARFTAHDYQLYARKKIIEILSRGKNVIIVGGTGLYIDATLFEHYTFGGRRASLPFDQWQLWAPLLSHHITWIGLVARPETLTTRIHSRALAHHDAVISEVSTLLKQHISAEWLSGLGLEPSLGLQEINGEITADEYIEQLTLLSRRYAKRQLTWFKRNKHIQWFDINEFSQSEIIESIEELQS